MWLVIAALRQPIAVVVLFLGLMLGGSFSVLSMPRDVFPDMKMPVIYVTETWPGYTPAQMEGLIVSKLEDHFLYIAGIEHIESKSIQGVTQMKLYFHPGTDTAYALAQVTAMVYRATAFMPPGTQPPYCIRLDQGWFPVCQLVAESTTRSDTEVQDLVLFRVRPMLATLKGVSAPPPFGGRSRMMVVDLDPQKLRQYGMSAEEVTQAVARMNVTLPEGAVRTAGKQFITLTNNCVPNIGELNTAPIRMGAGATVYLRDVGRAYDGGDVLVNLALVNGRRACYLPITKRADASTLSVIEAVRAKLPEMQAAVPPDVRLRLEFDQSIYVKNAIDGLVVEAILGAFLTGLGVLLFLRDARSAIVVVISIPTSIALAIIALALTGNTVNLMTVGGIALAVGILVDEATVEIENVHVHLEAGKGPARAVFDAMREVRIPRLVAMLCVCAVFIPGFYMIGAAKALFAALALAVSFSMIASYLVTSTLVPVIAVWFLRAQKTAHETFVGPRRAYEAVCKAVLRLRLVAIPAVLAASTAAAVTIGGSLPQELFPVAATDQLQFRLYAPDGTRLEVTEEIVKEVLDATAEVLGKDQIEVSIANLGLTPGMFPANAMFVWNSGPHEGLIVIALKPDKKRSIPRVQEQLRARFAEQFPTVRFSFEPGDVVSQVLNSGVANPVYLLVMGNDYEKTRQYAERIRAEVGSIPEVRDVMIPVALDYPTIKVDIDRVRAGQVGIPAETVGRTLVEACWTSQFTQVVFWQDKQGLGYFVMVRVPEGKMSSLEEVRNVPVTRPDLEKHLGGGLGERPLLRDAGTVTLTETPGEFDHWNSVRCIPVAANVGESRDIAKLARDVEAAIARAGAPPSPDIKVEVRGSIRQMRDTLGSLSQGLAISIVVVVLLLAATFQSFKDAFAVLLVIPSVIAGGVIALALTGTTLNIQSLMGLIMAIGVSVSNGVLVVKFFEDRRRDGIDTETAAWNAGSARLRPILMTSLCMLAGMAPMAAGLGEGGSQNAPLGRSVVGGLLLSTITTLLILPAILVAFHKRSPWRSVSLDADDPESPYFEEKRRHRRLAAVALVTYGKYREDGSREYGGTAHTIDVSHGGLQLKTAEPLKLGDVVQLDVATETGPARVAVTVLRVSHVQGYLEAPRPPRAGEPVEEYRKLQEANLALEGTSHYEVGCRFEGAGPELDKVRTTLLKAHRAEGGEGEA